MGKLVFFKADLSIGIQFGYESWTKVPAGITLISICGLQLKSFKKTNNFSFVGVALFEGTKKPPVHEAAGGF